MDWNEADFRKRFTSALGNFDRDGVDSLCDILVEYLNAGGFSLDESFAKFVLGSLQRKRNFRQLRRVADAIMQTGLVTPTVRRRYAQSLLEQGELSATVTYLKALVADTEADPKHTFEAKEAKGLLGRAYKQIYVNTWTAGNDRVTAILNSALIMYLTVYKSNPKAHSWHGINAAALLLRAAEDQILVDDIDEPGPQGRRIAAEVLAGVTELWGDWGATMWDSGTAMEACVALGRNQEAIDWLQRFVSEPAADAFEIGSTLRQLVELWRLEVDSEPGASLLPVLRNELLRREGGALVVSPKELRPGALSSTSPEQLEKIFGTARYHSYKDMQRAIARSRAVARVEHQPGKGYGTGFMVFAADLHSQLGDGYVLITNAHVISNDASVRDALAPEDAIITFQLLQEEGLAAEEYSVSELLWTSPPWKLDATVLRLNGIPDGIEPYPVHPRLPVPDGEQRVYIIGHPKGGTLSFSIQDNVLLDHETPYLHYRAPTEGGSSGSPVFNAQWRLIGLHHAGSHLMRRLNDKGGTYEANEGIWIQSVIQAIGQELSAAS